MKRSRVNQILRDGEAFIRSFGYVLPPFANWTPDELKRKRPPGVVDARLGWDITDYGQGRFDELGLFLVTVRNGNAEDLGRRTGGMVYAEKIMISRENQISPMHTHAVKTEDIINRGGGDLIVQLYNATPESDLAESDVTVVCDGVRRTVSAGGTLCLKPGESVTLEPYCWHRFWFEGGRVLMGEVSLVNDDNTDNCFNEPLGRFPTVEEDAAPLHLLVNDYARFLQG